MKRSNWLAFALVAIALAPQVLRAQIAADQAAAAAQAVVSVGKELFQKQFIAGEPVNPGGDGLGPVYNQVSCVACHQQGGLGGAGAVDVNAAMLSVEPTKFETSPEQDNFLKALRRIHPGLVTDDGQISPNVILHRFGANDKYLAMREKLVGSTIPFKPTDDQRQEIQQTLARVPVQPAVGAKPLRLVVTQRNTTALFGAGLIDRIPDAVLQGLAAIQSTHPEVSGRVPPIKLNRSGRFGWRGQTERLHDFVLGACANELGLEVPGTPQPIDPLRPKYRPASLDLTPQQCLSLTAFVASLPQPRFVQPEDAEKKALAEQGYKAFNAIGCAACHIENIGPVQGLFSDLLLHDMGLGLADPVVARPTMLQTEQLLISADTRYKQPGKIIADDVQVRQIPNPYYGGSTVQTIDQGTTYLTDTGISTVVPSPKDKKVCIMTRYEPVKTNLAQEWRTPPLWGLHDSAPYLHDGRAETVLEAIAQHGGEAEGSLGRFLALPTAERLAVLEFLGCLRAP